MTVKHKSRKASKPTKRLTWSDRERELKVFVALCFSCFETDFEGNLGDLKELSNTTKLSVSTLRRYQLGKVSLSCHFGSLQALGAAAGMRLQLTEYEARIVLV